MLFRKQEKKINAMNKRNSFLFGHVSKTSDEILASFSSSMQGLTDEKVQEYQEKYGKNIFNKQDNDKWYKILFSSFFNAFSIVLLLIAILYIVFQKEWVAFSIIISMFVLSGLLKFVQDFKARKTCEKLNDIVNTTAAVVRNNQKSEIDMEEIVPGDIIYISAGDMVPADMRLLSARDLFVTQSPITGESEPVEKIATKMDSAINNLLDCKNLCFMGTTVASGYGYGIAIQTGNNTFFGRIANLLTTKRDRSSFNKGIRKVSFIIIITMLVMSLLIFLINGILKTNIDNKWLEALTFAMAAAIGIVPEMLPMIVTLNLSKEAIKFSKQKAIIKNIDSIQTFGAMDVLCTDKTGTLTEDHIVLQEHLNIKGHEDDDVLFYGCLNSYYQTGLKNLIDKAIIEKAQQRKMLDDIIQYTKIDEIPFDFDRRRMSIILQSKIGEKQIITKGASEEVLKICKYVKDGNRVYMLTKQKLMKLKQDIAILNEKGMRVIVVAINNNKIKDNQTFTVKDEKNMIFVGYIALLDPPKMSAKRAINALIAKGVEVKILTGDNEKVTKNVCQELGLNFKNILLGEEIEKMSFNELQQKVIYTNIFAKLSPEQKALIVKVIKTNKHVVGFLGDGINDTPAMKAADIAISVDSGVDIAKESADVILLEKDLSILGNGVIQGRKTFANIMKYIKIAISSNFGNMLSLLIASFWLPFLPMQPIQILLLNIIFDFAQIAIPWDNVDIDFLQKPKNWSARSILFFMFVFGPISTIFDLIIFAILFYVLKYNDIDHPFLFNAGWFIFSAITQAINVCILRSKKISFIQTKPSKVISSLSVILTTLCSAIPFMPLINKGFKFTIENSTSRTIDPMFLLYVLAVIIGYVVLIEITKQIYLKIFKGQWL